MNINIGEIIVILGYGLLIIIGALVILKTKEMKNALSRLQERVISYQLIWKSNGCTGTNTLKNGSRLEMISLYNLEMNCALIRMVANKSNR